MVKNDQAVLQTKPLSIHSLYDDYAAMLLGYIYEVVKDKKVAEDFLVKTFSSVAQKFNDIDWGESNSWCQLQRIAKNELAAYNQATEGCETSEATIFSLPNKYLNKMTDEQQLVFCNIYYRKKTTAQLAAEINKSEELVKKLLKEAFTMIRKANEN
jgi:DNA-directed RNA polymerase specialized sigma24 family protein